MSKPNSDPIISRLDSEREARAWSNGGMDLRAGMPRGSWARVCRAQSANIKTIARYAATLGFELGLVARGEATR